MVKAQTSVEVARSAALGEMRKLSLSVEDTSHEVRLAAKAADAELAVQLSRVETTIADSVSKVSAMEKHVVSTNEQLAMKEDQMSIIQQNLGALEQKSSSFEEKFRQTDGEKQKMKVNLVELKANLEAASQAISSREQMISKLQSLETVSRRERDVQAQKVKESNSKMEGIVTVLEATSESDIKQPVKNALVDVATRKSMTKEDMNALKDKLALDLAMVLPAVPKSSKAKKPSGSVDLSGSVGSMSI